VIPLGSLIRPWPLFTLVVLALASAARSASWLNPDTSALITFAEKWLDGTDPYAVFNEINPPASILLYVPDVLVGRMFGISPEAILTASLLITVAATLWITARILARAHVMDTSQSWILAPFACAIFLLLPEDVFSEREHIAVIAILPLLAMYVARVSGNSVAGWTGFVAGAGAGLAIVIKPYFALALVFPFLYAAWTLRRRRSELAALILSRENLVIALVAAVYAAAVTIWFRDYLEVMLPIVQHVYGPFRFPLAILLVKWVVILPILGLAAVFIIAAPRALRPQPLVLVLAATGFWLAALIQGKGWPYHSYPAIALTLIASLVVAIERWPSHRVIRWRVTTIGLVGGLCALSIVFFRPIPWYPQYVATIERVAPKKPRLMAICGISLEYLWPISRIVNGEAIGHGLWVNEVTMALKDWDEVDEKERLIVDRYARDERRAFTLAMQTQHPNVLIVCDDGWKEWALGQSEFAAEMKKFHEIAKIERAEIWLPK
jgi:hypothetical protein